MIVALITALAAPTLTHAEWMRDREGVLAARDPEAPVPGITALGRLRDEANVPLFAQALGSSDAHVAIAAARSLGWTPGSGPTILRALREQPIPVDRHVAHGLEFGLHWQLVEASGRQGDADHLPLLVERLRSPWPLDAAAARAILRLHRREVDVASAVPDLVDALERPDPRTGVAVAQALTRIGLRTPTDGAVRRVRERARSAPVSEQRVALLKAVVHHLPHDQREQTLRWAHADRPLVRAGMLGLLEPRDAGPFASSVVADLAHPSWMVQRAAIDAAGRLGLHDALRTLRPVDPWQAGRIAAALGTPYDASASWQVQAATVDQLPDDDLLALAGGTEAPAGVRSAAMGALLGRSVSSDALVRLLVAPDAAIRDAAVFLLADHPSAENVEELVLTLRVERDHNVVAAVLKTLLDWGSRGIVTPDRYLESALKREARSRTPRIRDAAVALAGQLGIPVEAEPEKALVRELILPDGTVTTTTGDLPDPAEIHRYTTAIVYTDHGPITIALEPEVAPLAVHNFVSLARSGFFDGLTWHRTVPGFVAQGGCPRGDGWGGPGWTIVDEVSDRPFTTGAVGMARGDRDTGGSQFFVMTGPGRFLDGDYTRFGRVTAGMEAARALSVGSTIERVAVGMEQP